MQKIQKWFQYVDYVIVPDGRKELVRRFWKQEIHNVRLVDMGILQSTCADLRLAGLKMVKSQEQQAMQSDLKEYR